jgi:hypothetical protein
VAEHVRVDDDPQLDRLALIAFLLAGAPIAASGLADVQRREATALPLEDRTDRGT